jgi:hypothetical protein
MKTRLGISLAFLSFKARCDSGCGWKDLHYSCGGEVPCCLRVDEQGVHGAKCPTAGD